MNTQQRSKKYQNTLKNFLAILTLGWLVSCGGASTGTGGSAEDTDCAFSDNDFYVVENASCETNAGKLSRLNPDETCKEEILTQLDCPVDFVLSSDGRSGYLSLHTNNAVGGVFDNQPGEIYAVDVVSKTKILMNETYNRSFVRPSGIALIEGLSQAERDQFCGGNTIVQDLLVVADQGEEAETSGTSDSGTVWAWCVNTDDYEQSLTPMAVLSLGADQMENPRGVAVLNRETLIVTAQATDDSQGLLLVKDIDSTSAAEISVEGFSSEIGDVTIDGTVAFVADGGSGTIVTVPLTGGDVEVISGFTTPADILVGSDNTLVITQSSENNVVATDLLESLTSLTPGISLETPMGVAR